MKITHQLSIQLSKTLFITESGLVVHLLENTLISEAIEAKLKPLLIYSINIEGMSCRFVQFSSIDKPLSLVSFLNLAWSEINKEGMPQVLKVSKILMDQFPWLTDFTNQLNIELVIADGKDRSFTANQAAAQGIAKDFHYSNSPRDNDHNISSLPVVAEMNKPRYFQDGWLYGNFGLVSSMEAKAISDYKQLDKSYISSNIRFNPDWNSFPSENDWLLHGQKGIAPRSLLTIKNDIARSVGEISYEEFSDSEEYDGNNILEGNDLVKKLLNCWPQSKSSVAKGIDVTLKDLEWYLAGKKGLDEPSFYSLCDYIDMGAHHEFQYEDGSPLYVLSGNYLLQAGNKLTHIDNIFYELTNGGDCTYKVELLPDNGRPDPSFRFLLFGRHLDFNIIVFNRSSPAVSFIDVKKHHSNSGAESVVIPTKMYSDILRLFGEVSRGSCHPAKIRVRMINWYDEIEKINEQFYSFY